jgi:hypothetical protein
MDATDFHREVRNVLALSDELSRHEHALGDDELAGHLGAARTALAALDRAAGRSHRRRIRANPADVGALARTVTLVRHRAGQVPEPLRARLAAWSAGIDRVVFAARRPTSSVPSKPLFGRLPLARLVPSDLHSMLDYVAAAAYAATALFAKDRDARATSVFLAADLAGISLSSDVRLALWRLLPVELHELMDHASGVFAMVAPFVLRYARKDPKVAAVHVATGALTILASLATDYRAMRGVSRARRSKGGPHRRLRVPDAQRPLEGLAAPSYF